jgi:hypothetical protein
MPKVTIITPDKNKKEIVHIEKEILGVLQALGYSSILESDRDILDHTEYSNLDEEEINIKTGIQRYQQLISQNEKLLQAEQKNDDASITEEQCKEMEIFTDNREKKLEELEKEAKYYSSEALKIKDLNISSELFKSIFHICQYLFEYDEDLIEYYKTHTYVSTMNFQKERMLKHALEEAEEM